MCECLPFRPIKNKSVQWRALADDDHIAEIKLIGLTYTLRVEQMDRHAWWGCFYINDSMEWANDGAYAKTEMAAKRQAVRALNTHRKKC